MIWKYYMRQTSYERKFTLAMYNWYEVYSWPALEVEEALTLGVF